MLSSPVKPITVDQTLAMIVLRNSCGSVVTSFIIGEYQIGNALPTSPSSLPRRGCDNDPGESSGVAGLGGRILHQPFAKPVADTPGWWMVIMSNSSLDDCGRNFHFANIVVKPQPTLIRQHHPHRS